MNSAKKNIKAYLFELLVLTDSENEFLNAFQAKKYMPKLLFEDEMLERVKRNPMALWKMRVQ